MSLTKKKASTAAATLREAVESGEFANSETRAMSNAAASLEAFAGDDNEDAS
jgi:hypothetical protein